jgi:DNA-binding MarR family transcriptional regulator
MTDDRESLRVWLALLAASNTLKKSVDTGLRNQFGVSISRFDVLAALERAGPEGLRAGALTRRLMATEGNTTQVTAPLIRDGLVKRTTSPEDKRVAIFSLTRKGEKLFAKMAEENRRWVASAFSNFSESQLATFRKLLGKLKPPFDLADDRKDAA